MLEKLGCKTHCFFIKDFVADMATDVKRAMSPNTLGNTYPLFSLSFFCVTLVLKYGGSHIMELGGRAVKACLALLLRLG